MKMGDWRVILGRKYAFRNKSNGKTVGVSSETRQRQVRRGKTVSARAWVVSVYYPRTATRTNIGVYWRLSDAQKRVRQYIDANPRG